jgi:serine/threonine-protein kinase
VAVLPFRPSGGGSDSVSFADGLTQEVITALAGIENVRVIARTSSSQYRDPGLDVCRIGEELKVDAIVEGAVSRAGDRQRVTVRLAGVAEGVYLWAGTFERDARDVFRVQEDLAMKIAEAAREHLPKRPAEQIGAGTAHPEAACAYLKGRHCLAGQNAGDVAKALEYFSQAVALDARMAAAHAGIAACHAMLACHGFADPRECRPRANEAAARARALDARSPEILAVSAVCSLLLNWDWAAAEDAILRALRAGPGCAPAHQWYGVWLACRGDFSEAAAELHQAYRADPAGVARSGLLGRVLHHRGDRAGALRHYLEAVKLDPRAFPAHEGLGWVYLDTGDTGRAMEEFEQARALSGSGAILLGAIGCCHAVAGRTASARAVLRDLEDLAGNAYVSPVEFARLHVGLREYETAFRWLEKAAGHRSPALIWMKTAPLFSKLHRIPGFGRLAEVVGLERAPNTTSPGRAG